MFDPRADLFFEDPRNKRVPPGDYGVLYLLRRDACFCLGWDPTSGSKTSHPALWPGGMAIFAGIDLVAKFYRGDDTTGQVGSRFRDFVSKYFQPISAGDEETIYPLRNSLLHSFGLYSKTKKQAYHFLLTAGTGVPFIQQPAPGSYQVDLITLHQRFEQALGKYVADLESNAVLQRNFLKMFTNYGAIHMG
jgi:hypothetical protein